MTSPQTAELRPGARFASGALLTLRRDLASHPFALRPLPPLGPGRTARWERRLPGWTRRYVRWVPHAVVCASAASVFLGSVAKLVDFGAVGAVGALLFCALVAVPVVMVLFRPVGAFWVSLAGVAVGLPAGSADFGGGPWAGISLLCHLLVMTLVVLRTRPRLAVEMWLVTLALSSVLATLTDGFGSALPGMAAFSGAVLVAAAAVAAWSQERRHVAETETVTARERSRRTLLEERNTIARELHDVLAHHMSVIAIQAEAAPYRVEDTPPELATALSTIRENAVAALTELRRILGAVRAEDPDAFADGAPEAPQPTLADLDALLDSVRGTGLEVEAVVTGAARPLSQGVELSAYRIVQEGLSNALRHSPGAPARVELAYVLGGLGLRVVNVRPAEPAGSARAPGGGHGLLGMRERVQVLGGEMTAGATEDGGFEVAVFLPAPAAATGEGTA